MKTSILCIALRYTMVISLLASVVGCQEILQEFERPSNPQTSDQPQFLTLPGDSLFPEGIITAANGDLYVSGFGDASILRVTEGKHVTTFKESGADGLFGPVGMAIDEERRRLWVANFDLSTLRSNMKVFDLNTKALLATLTIAEDGLPHLFNELVTDKEGNVYISDTPTPIIWKASADLEGLSVFVEDPLLLNPNRPFGLNGLAFTPDGKYMIASVIDRISPGGGRLTRIDLATQEVREVELSGFPRTIATFGGSDGMLFEPDGSLIMVNVTPPASLVTANFNEDYSAAELIARERYEEVFNRPTTLAIRKNRLWVVNSQADHIIDDGNGALGTPPDLPFELVSLPLKNVLIP